MGSLVFATPWLLAAAALLPALYLLLRLTPPAPRRVKLPSLKLLGERDEPPPPASRPPLWLLLLRLGAVALLLVGLAGPTWKPAAIEAVPARLTLIVDNGWIAGADWPRLRAAALDRLDALRLAGTEVAVVPTAAPPGGWPKGRPPAPRFVDVATARATVEAMRAWPWPTDRVAVAARLPDGDKLWIADGVEDAGAAALRRALAGQAVQVVRPRQPAIRVAGRSGDGWAAQLVRPESGPDSVALIARDARGGQLGRTTVAFEGATATARLALDAAARNRVARLTLDSPGAGAVVLADADSGRPRVALVDGARQGDAAPLESGAFYVRRALEPHAEVAPLALDAALRDPANLILLVDAPVPSGDQTEVLLRRVRAGAVAVSFAGPRIAENGTTASPAPLRAGARALGGVFSWQAPQRIGGYAEDGPLARLPAPPEATVARQILGRDDSAGAMRWAWLNDGTPLVTARREGNGLLVFVHTSAAPGWSELPLTGLFEAMLRRLLPLAANPASFDIAADRPLTLDRMLDADGELVPAPIRARIAPADWERVAASPKTPPGLYRAGDVARPLNLDLGPAFRFAPLRTDGLRVAGAATAPIDIGRWLILAAMLLIVVDGLVALKLRGALPRLAATAALLLFAAPSPAEAAQAQVQLGYVRTGDPALDRNSAEGLASLGRALTMRTAVATAAPQAVDPARDSMGRFPLLYWPVASARPLSPAVAARVRAYLDRGGLILFDFVGGNDDGATARTLLGPLGLPQLEEVNEKHVLARSFYLIRRLPPGTWTEAGTAGGSDRVAGVVIGGAGWANAWSDRSAVPLARREEAWRFGINLVIYALTGTYKADQVHTRALLDRMGTDARR
ncbi:DUF4159 domain-containing protein [Sphingoaurantiacus capsulatus]|uniref:DUF4159 domain-containing protein n=1 Tax=Sphingoaurantiacus capsulatus TaxID=1771310 RepID=A0ABV7XAY0_9SPHN